MPLIRTKLLPATNTKGTRIKAYYQDKSITIGYNYTGRTELERNHRATCIALMDYLGFDWLDLDILSERLNNWEYVHVWNTQVNEAKKDTDTNLPGFLKPQA